MRDRFINLVLYQAGWFAMVLGAANGFPWKGSAAGFILCCLHLCLARELVPEVKTVLIIGVMGTLVDSAQALAGVFVFESGYWSYWFVPLWLTVMWMQFATLFHYALSWLSDHYFLSATLGLVGGPLAFYAGERLGGVIFPMGTARSMIILAVVWAMVTPACVFIASVFKPSTKVGSYRFPNF
jgi:hypothetical protein